MPDQRESPVILELLKEGINSLKQKKYRDAAKTFDLILRAEPGNASASQGKAISLARLGRYEQAEEHLEGFLERNPQAYVNQRLKDHIQERQVLTFNLIPSSTDKLLQPLLHVFSVSPVFEILAKSRDVHGFLSDREAASLFHLAQNGSGSGVIVEIGSFCGKSTIFLASGAKSLRREAVYAIDPHTGSPEHQEGGMAAEFTPKSGTTFPTFQKNLKRFGVEDWVKPIVDTSENAVRDWELPIRLLFIDGDHDYSMVEQDFLSWHNFISPGGLVAFHDCSRDFEGPRKVVEKHVLPSREYRTLAHVDSLYIAERILSA